MMPTLYLRAVHLSVGEMYVLLCKRSFSGYQMEAVQTHF